MKEKDFPAKEKRTAASGTSRLSSIKTRVVSVLLFSLIATVLLSIWIIIPNVKKNITSTTQSYMLDLTASYGKVLDQNTNISIMYLHADRLETLLDNVGLQNVDSSYFYVLGPEGNILFHPDKNSIGQTADIPAVSSLLEQVREGDFPEPDILSYDYKGQGYMLPII